MAEDDIWDSWEDFADSTELDKHVDEHLRLTNGSSASDREELEMQHNIVKTNLAKSEAVDSPKNSNTQFRILQRPVVHEDDVNRTAYAPQVKILKRPGHDPSAANAKDKDKQKAQPARTLAEREAAYAEARKRIMGPVSNSAVQPTNSGKTRPENRRSKNMKNETSQSSTVHHERQPRGPDKTGRGFHSPRRDRYGVQRVYRNEDIPWRKVEALPSSMQ